MLRGLKAKGCQTDSEASDEGGCEEQLDLQSLKEPFLAKWFNKEP